MGSHCGTGPGSAGLHRCHSLGGVSVQSLGRHVYPPPGLALDVNRGTFERLAPRVRRGPPGSAPCSQSNLTNQLCLWFPGREASLGLPRETPPGLEDCRLRTLQPSDHAEGIGRGPPPAGLRAPACPPPGSSGRPEARARGPGVGVRPPPSRSTLARRRPRPVPAAASRPGSRWARLAAPKPLPPSLPPSELPPPPAPRARGRGGAPSASIGLPPCARPPSGPIARSGLDSAGGSRGG